MAAVISCTLIGHFLQRASSSGGAKKGNTKAGRASEGGFDRNGSCLRVKFSLHGRRSEKGTSKLKTAW